MKKLKLNDLGSVGRGKSKHRPRNDEALYNGPYPFVQTGDVKAANFYLNEYTQTYSELGLSQSKLWPKGTLLITIAANIGDTAILGIDACFPDSIVGFQPYEGVSDVRYVKYYLDFIKLELEAISRGTTQDNMSLDKLLTKNIFVHEYTEQVKIASILSAYDELIENNKQRIKLLEEMAEEIYKEWFVRFRFPGYESTRFLNEQGKEVPHGTVGALPDGWANSRLESVCEFQMGQSPSSEFYNEEKIGLPFHQGVTNFSDRFPNHITYCTDLKRIANEGEILLSVRAPVGRINIATTKLVIGRGLCSVKHKMNLINYCYYLLKDVFREEDSFGNGAVFNAVSKNDLLRIRIIKPINVKANQFQEFVKPMDDEIRILSDKNQLLQQTRDLLLPRLISGKLSVEHLGEQEELEPMAMAAEQKPHYGKR
ncbi:MAG: restriction endonuclease subunit S [Cyclobacteriaceae bacterium]